MGKRRRVTVVLAVFMVASAHAQTAVLFAVAITGTPQDVQAAIDKGADVNAYNSAIWTGVPRLKVSPGLQECGNHFGVRVE